jgi:hypothetical protein
MRAIKVLSRMIATNWAAYCDELGGELRLNGRPIATNWAAVGNLPPGGLKLGFVPEPERPRFQNTDALTIRQLRPTGRVALRERV